MRIGSRALFIISSAIWGSTWLAIKYQLGIVAPELSVAYRFALVSIAHGGSAGFGVALALGGATAIACCGNMLAIRNHQAGIPTFPGTAWGMAYGSLTATIAAAVQGVPWTFDTSAAYVLSLSYLAVFGSVIAFGAYLTLLNRVGGVPASFVGIATPVIALALSTLFEGYRWTWIAALGVVLAATGNWLALRPGTREA